MKQSLQVRPSNLRCMVRPVPHEKRPQKDDSPGQTRSRHARAAQKSARPQRRRKIRARSRIGGDAAGALGSVRTIRPLGRLLAALEAEKVRFILIGMSAAIAQGVMGSTIDVDLWIGLPPRQYMRLLRIAQRVGATVAANTVVYLEDGTPVNFVYEVTGLENFASELRHTLKLFLHGSEVRVLTLERIRKSKAAIGRDKDHLHLAQIDEFLRCRRTLRRR